MKKTKIIVSSVAFFWIVLAILVCYGATRLGLGTVTEPGSGFIFFWLGLVLVMLSLAAFAESLRGSEAIVQETREMNWVKIALVLLSLLLYAFFLERLGFVLTTFLLLSFLLGWIEQANWIRSLVVSTAAALGSFAIFELWLKIRLPKGIFGF
ncbi:MAG TPA: tripartite tricarboxylate transporter TctB family protein [Candidatus Binatia bacterium]|nr:tripartite tricarboxylate transporter TctB family protein [Candidatus Binatia bacterium]